MRLLAVRLQNLNSLSGPLHEVRFDAPPLANAGVFLITGPTGAGKSTLLDAVTLALYGRAARYGNDKADEMMSRHTAECLAEVEFETHGRKLRATWRLRRARGKADGKMQPVERRLADAVTGDILAEKAAEMDRMIEQMTGLDAQRFLRSVLLAQGQFATFLKAKPNERAELLEKITGTEIYSDLSVLAFDTHKAKEEAVARMSALRAALTVLSDEERVELESRLNEAKDSAARLHLLNQAATTRLNEGRQLQQMQRDQAALMAEMAKGTTLIQSLTQQQTEAIASVAKAQNEATAARQARAMREPIWEQAAKLTAQSDQFETLLVESRAVYQTQAKEQKAAVSRCAASQVGLAKHDQDTQALDAWLIEHAADAVLAEKLVQLRVVVRDWRMAFQSLEQGKRVQAESKLLTKKHDESVASVSALDVSLKAARESVATQRKELERLTLACEQQRQVVEHAQRVAGFEEHRHELKEGEACPLCGALDHPFSTAAVNFTSQLQAARRLLIGLDQERDALTRTVTTAESSVTRSEERLRGEKEKIKETEVQLSKLVVPDTVALESAEGSLREQAAAALLHAATPDAAEHELGVMEMRARTFAAKLTEANEQRAKRQKIEAEIQLASQDVEAKAKRLEELKAEGVALKSRAEALKQLLAELLGERTLAQDRQWHEQTLADAEKKLREMETLTNSLGTKIAAAKAAREQQEARRIDLEARLAGAEVMSADMVAELERSAKQLAEQLATQQKSAGMFEERARNDDEARRRRESSGAELKTAEEEALRWGRLKELMGSADGSKFARFAQSLTLRQLISLANQHLTVLAPRYRLIAASGDELDLRIVDLYQAGVDRPMESLSGGESFLASLSLALGLSELASRHHPIDSLFIDEGFGSLDSETLEIAMSALENLHSRGKTIGLISHVETMKERMTTQIRVVRGAAGTSRIEVV